MAFPGYRHRQSYPTKIDHHARVAPPSAPYGYVKIEHQAGGVIVESAGERRMFDPGPDLAAHLNTLLAAPLKVEIRSKCGGSLQGNLLNDEVG